MLERSRNLRPSGRGGCQHPYCQECWQSVLERYGEFRIRCRGIRDPQDFLPQDLLLGLSDDERQMAYAIYDPVLWAQLQFGWVPRVTKTGLEYQGLMLRCTAQRKIFRCGRRVGKCLHGSARVLTAYGPLSIAHLYTLDPKPPILTFDLQAHSFSLTTDYLVWQNGIQPLWRLTTRSGRQTLATGNHPFLTRTWDDYSWCMAMYLRPGMPLAIPMELEYDGHALTGATLGWDEVLQVEPVQADMTYDLTVYGTHTLVADELVSHNSTTIAVRLLHFMGTTANGKVLLITPYKAQIDIIFGMVEEFISKSPWLQQSIKRNVANPYHEIEFYNGSYLRGFTSGARSGTEAGSIRGQAADIVILDEMDFLSPGDINAITAILHDHPDTQLWAASTPTGRRDKFYEWCHSPRYKEFHFPSNVLLHWDEEMEAEQRENLTELGYKHEVLAEFGDEEEGVFQKHLIESALRDYRYEDLHPETGWVYGMGIDWNSEAFGTEIIVVGFNGETFRVVASTNVSKAGWNQLAAIEAVIAMNRQWQPMFIKADEGFGSTSIEVLKKYGLDRAGTNAVDARLPHILEAVNFSAKIEIPDPITKTKIKKPMKPFLVENTVRFFERQNLEISRYDTILINQLENYIIKRRTSVGMPIYCARKPKIGDHKLDGLMLALMGFTERFSDLMQVPYTALIRFTGRPGEHLAQQQRLEELAPEVVVESSRIQTGRLTRGRPEMYDRMSTSPQAVTPSMHGGNPLWNSGGLWRWPGFLRDEPPPTRTIKLHRRPTRRNI